MYLAVKLFKSSPENQSLTAKYILKRTPKSLHLGKISTLKLIFLKIEAKFLKNKFTKAEFLVLICSDKNFAILG